MSLLTTALDAQLDLPGVTMFGAVQIDLPGYTLRLIDGAGQVSFGFEIWPGLDPTYGALGNVEKLSDGGDRSAPTLRLYLLVPSNTATATLADPGVQGSAVTVYIGAVDPTTGDVIADPYLHSVWALDVPTVLVSADSKVLQYDLVSEWDLLLDGDEGVRLNGPWHNSIWPGELGLEFITSVQQQMPWGSDAARPVMITDMRTVYAPGAAAGLANGSGYFRPSTTYI